jgi:hypothetical protein
MNNTTEKPKFLTLKEAAELVDGLTVFRLRQMCLNNEIGYRKFGRKFVISEKILLDFVDGVGNSVKGAENG